MNGIALVKVKFKVQHLKLNDSPRFAKRKRKYLYNFFCYDWIKWIFYIGNVLILNWNGKKKKRKEKNRVYTHVFNLDSVTRLDRDTFEFVFVFLAVALAVITELCDADGIIYLKQKKREFNEFALVEYFFFWCEKER